MPRKVKSGPPILKIEGLSDGREIRDETFICDLTGEVKPVVQDMKPVRVMKSAQEVTNEINKAKREFFDKVLHASLLAKAKPVELVPIGKRKIAELNGMAVLVPRKPWRRV